MSRKKIYDDDTLISKCFRVSLKYEHDIMRTFLLILRKFRNETLKFINEYKGKL